MKQQLVTIKGAVWQHSSAQKAGMTWVLTSLEVPILKRVWKKATKITHRNVYFGVKSHSGAQFDLFAFRCCMHSNVEQSKTLKTWTSARTFLMKLSGFNMWQVSTCKGHSVLTARWEGVILQSCDDLWAAHRGRGCSRTGISPTPNGICPHRGCTPQNLDCHQLCLQSLCNY